MFGSARSVKNPGAPAHNIQTAYYSSANVPYRKQHQFQCSGGLSGSIGPILGNYSLGRNLADADVADHKWLKVESNERERVVIEIISSWS
jgi:hypothetical protein